MRDCMFVFVWHARSTLQTPWALSGPLVVLQNNRKNRSTVKMTVSKPCNLQYLASEMICARGFFFCLGMRDLDEMHVGPVTPTGVYNGKLEPTLDKQMDWPQAHRESKRQAQGHVPKKLAGPGCR